MRAYHGDAKKKEEAFATAMTLYPLCSQHKSKHGEKKPTFRSYSPTLDQLPHPSNSTAPT